MCLFDAFTENEDSIKLFYDMDQKGILDLYYQGSVHVPIPEKIDEAINTVRVWQKKYTSEHVHINTIKLFVDGTNEMGDCCSLRPFSNDPAETNKGAVYLSEEQLQSIMVKLNNEGIDLHLHVICDGAFRLVLNALERAQSICGDAWNIHVTAAHCELIDPVITLDPEKYPGSVRPPETARLTLEELLRGYTINNAVRMRLQDKMGSLEKSKLANFMILNKDIFTVPAAEISSVTAECTYFEGKERRMKSTLSVGRESEHW